MNEEQKESSNKSSTTIKNWAPDDRPREKLLIKGKEALSDSELLAILLNTGSGKKSAVDLAKEVLMQSNNNLVELGKKTVESLIQIKGIGHAKAITIIAAMELSRRRTTSSLGVKKVSNSIEIAALLREKLKDLAKEVFVVVFLNARNSIIQHETISTGGFTSTIVDPRLIFNRALELKAVKLVLCHNHPSGNLRPSRQDELLTERIVNAGKILDIQVVDHIIVSEEGYFSFADEGKL